MGPDRLSASEMLRSTHDGTGDAIAAGMVPVAQGDGTVAWEAQSGGGGGGGGVAGFHGARAVPSATTSLSDNTWTSVALAGTDRFDSDAYHDPASNNSRMTIPAGLAGKYLLVGNGEIQANATGRRGIRFLLNGATRIGGEKVIDAASGSLPTRMDNSTVYDLEEGDYVELQLWQDSGSTLNSGNTANATSEFMLVLLGAATAIQPNMIHNPRFRTNQRGYASAGSLASGEYGFDRWKATTASTSLTYTAASQGQQVTISSGGSIAQLVERENVIAGDYVLSWEGTATGRVYNSGGSAPSYASSPVTVTLDGSANVVVEFEANGGTKTLDKVKLEPGATPTGFIQPDVAAEMIQCMRFFQAVASWTGHGNGTTVIEMSYQYPVRMRAAPSMSKWPSATLNYRNNGGDTNVAAATWNIANNTQTAWGLWTQFTGNTSLTSNRPYHSRMGANGGPVLALSADL